MKAIVKGELKPNLIVEKATSVMPVDKLGGFPLECVKWEAERGQLRKGDL